MRYVLILGQPVNWHAPTVVRHGRFVHAFSKPALVRYEARLRAAALARWQGPPLLGPVALTVSFYLRRPKRCKREAPTVRPDLTNYLKALEDGLAGVVFADDAQVVETHARKAYAPPGWMPHAVVEVEELNP